MSVEELRLWLVEHYLEGTDPESVRVWLVEAGWMAEREYTELVWDRGQHTSIPFSTFLATVDLNGDGENEWLVSLRILNENLCGNEYPGELWVVDAEGVVYRLSAHAQPSMWTVPAVIAVEDLTGDALPDVVTLSIGCTAHTVFGLYHVLSAHTGVVSNLVRPNSRFEDTGQLGRSLSGDPNGGWSTPGISLSASSVEIVWEEEETVPSLLITGGTYGSAGAGCVRSRTEKWQWVEPAVTLTEVRWDEWNALVPVLYTADFYFALGESEEAIRLYRLVIEDDTLETFPFCFELGAPGEQEYSRAYAAFRLVLVGLLLEDEAQAAQWHNWLQSNYPEQPLATAAGILLTQWYQERNLGLACQHVAEYLANTTEPTGPLSYTGYANPRLTHEAVCPVK